VSDLPLVFIVGDSISKGYTPFVEKELAGRARIVHHAGNGGDSNNVLSNLSGWLAELGGRPAVIHANAGLHDLRFWTEKNAYQVPLESYRQNLAILAKKLRAAASKAIWASTTPVLDGAPNMSREFPRKNADVRAYNAAAAEAMRAAGVPVNDLNALVEGLGPAKLINPDGVHFSDEGYARLGAAVARAVAEAL
jgi:acyl-CoA thioesterase-1